MVDIDDKHRCHVLTNALRNGNPLPSTADFITSYGRFTVVHEAAGSVRARDALFIRLELNKIILLIFFLFSLILSVVLGVVMGVWEHNLDSGFGIGGGILGAIGIVEGFLTCLLK